MMTARGALCFFLQVWVPARSLQNLFQVELGLSGPVQGIILGSL